MSQSRLLPDISSVIDGFTSVVRSVINAASRTLQPSAAVGTSAVIPFRTGDHAGSDINLPTADVGSPEETVPLRSAEIIQFPVGRWNYGKNGQLRKSVKRGIAAAAAAAPHLADLAERIIPRLPGKPSVSNDLKCAGRKTSSWAELLMYATTRPWISFNTESATNAITIDCDHDNLDLLDDIIYKHGCPPPTFVASDPWSGRFHVTWFLMCPVKTALGANPKPKALLDRARGLLTDALNGDKRFTNRLTKNPFGLKSDLAGSLRRCTPTHQLEYVWDVGQAFDDGHLVWQTRDYGGQPVKLGEIVASLADDFVAEKLGRRHIPASDDSYGRNCTVFDGSRKWAYRNFDRCVGNFNSELASVAAEINRSFPVPLPEAEVAHTVKSIDKFMHTRWRGRTEHCDRGAMGLLLNLTTEEKQALSGPWSAAKRRNATDRKLAEAVTALRARGARITPSQVVHESGMSERTVKSRWKQLMAADVTPPSSQGVRVQDGVHQGLPSVAGGEGASGEGVPPNGVVQSVEDSAASVRLPIDVLEDVSTATVDIDVELDSTVSVPEVVVPIRRFHDFSLQRASASGQLEAVKLAIGKGADVNMPMHGSTALHEASRNGHYDVAKLLISEGADVNALRFGSTALHDAARYGHSDLVKLLITKDADINARNREGSTPLHVAVGYDHPSAAEHVQFHTKVEQRHLVVLHGLISAGADVNAANAVGDAPLHLAARSGQDSLVEFLVFERADVNAVNDVGDTPLHEAARNGQGAVAKFLISEGADVNAANTVGDTPQQLADAFYRDVLVHEAAHGKYADGASPLQLAAASYRGRFAAACDRGTADELERRRRRKRHRRQFPKQSCRPAGGWVPAEVASHTSSPWDILRGMLGGSGGEDRVLNLIRGPFAAWRMHMPDSSLPDLISDLESAYADETAVLCAIAHELASLVPTAKSGQWSATALQGNRTAA